MKWYLKRGYLLLPLFCLFCSLTFAGTTDILKDGLLGGASGAVGGAASGAKSGELWKGALAGAATNVVGGALIDTISGKKEQPQVVHTVQPQVQYVDRVVYQDRIVEKPVEKIVYIDREPPGLSKKIDGAYTRGYTKGVNDGYKQAWKEMQSIVDSKLRSVIKN